MAYDCVWSSRYNVLPVADTELESEKRTESVITPPADKTARDSECGTEHERESNGGDTYYGNRVGVCHTMDNDGDFRERNSPVKCLYGRKPIFDEPSEDPLIERLMNNLFIQRIIFSRERYVQRDSRRENKWDFEKGLHDIEEHLSFSTSAFIREYLAEAVAEFPLTIISVSS